MIDLLPLFASPFLTSLVSSLNPRVAQLWGHHATLHRSKGHQSIVPSGAAGLIALSFPFLLHSHLCLPFHHVHPPHLNSRRGGGQCRPSAPISFRIGCPPHLLHPTYSHLPVLQSPVQGPLFQKALSDFLHTHTHTTTTTTYTPPSSVFSLGPFVNDLKKCSQQLQTVHM